MALITLRVLDGADRGRNFSNLPTPVSIGREEGNSLQLNDERVSRFHLKIQEDQGQFVLTDLESTNGTKVNGEDAQLRILRFGDIISVGRSVILFGSRQEIAERLISVQAGDPHMRTMVPEELRKQAAEASLDYEENWSERIGEAADRKLRMPPELPAKLTPLQAAQLCEVIEFVHVRLRDVLNSVKEPSPGQPKIAVEDKPWQGLVDLQWRLAEYLRGIAEPKQDDV
jgi:predicted component of type VI protein secretion system